MKIARSCRYERLSPRAGEDSWNWPSLLRVRVNNEGRPREIVITLSMSIASLA